MKLKTDTAQQLRKVVNFMQGLSQAADELESIGALEQAIGESKTQLEVAREAQRLAAQDLLGVKLEIDQAREVGPALIAAAEAEAKQRADDIVMAANAKAQTIVNAALHQADGMAAASQDERAIVLAELAAVRAQSAAIRDEVGLAQNQVQTLAKEHDRLAKAVERIKAQFA